MSLPRQFSYNQDVPEMSCADAILGAQLSSSVNVPVDPINVAMSTPEYAGSLLSIQSAPQPLSLDKPSRPSSLVVEIPLAAAESAPLPSYLNALASPSEQAEEDSLLTLSSVTARPLLAASKELRGNKANISSKKSKKGGDTAELARRRNIRNTDEFQAPDGGYGWIVVFGAFMVQFWVTGLFKSYGVLYVEIMETFPGSSASLASWIPAILSALCLALAPLSSALSERFSCRVVVFTGGLFCAGGLALSYFATNLAHLLLSFGVMTGIGGGLSTTPGIVIVSQYFDNHRALANGICVSGTAAGSFVFPMLIEKLVDSFGFHGTILLLGGGMLHVCVSATLYKPPPYAMSECSKDDDIETDTQREGGSPNNLPSLCTTTTEDTTLLSFDSTGKIDGKFDSVFDSDKLAEMNRRNIFLSRYGDKIIDDDDIMMKLSPRSNLLSDMFHPSLIEVAKPYPSPPFPLSDSEDSEGLDVLGVTSGLPFHMQQKLRPTRSSSLLHSVEDLSTDSTCVYKARGRGLSRSMYIKPPVLARNRLAQSRFLAEMESKIAAQDSKAISPTASINGIIFKDKNNEKIRKDEQNREDVEKLTITDKISRYLDVSLLKNCNFMLVCTSVALMSTGSPYALYYLPAYTVQTGHTKSEAGRLVAISAVLDLVGRLGLGWLCDLNLFDRKKAYMISILFAGLAVLAMPLAGSWWIMALASGCYGLCLGCWFLLVPVLLADMFGTARISSSYGLVRMFQSIAAMSVPPLAGLMRDVTGGYAYVFYCMGSCMILGTFPVLIFGSSFTDYNGST